ncbi:glycosyl transferase family protein [Lacticaseibacillus camelliae DSM 22697 = JCM 13995]|uniref:Glycosyl transferase family protein n=2 Tax=Lacticaseibacillus camelliae TaxID=381742 RepID=A0A0R2FB35_9LACO|nr:glycosyl transferase family protein [Lacticaseibacillus camelliae DSM 22697 = JCM 13995]
MQPCETPEKDDRMTYSIFYAVDDNYVDPLTVSLHSLTRNTAATNQYHVIVMTEHLTPAHKAQIQAEQTANVTVSFESIADRLKAQITDKNNKLRADYFTFTIYFRLFIAELFPALDRAVYLDADTVVLTDIAELFAENLHGDLLGAVHDPFMAVNPETTAYTRDAIGVDVHQYCNSGVLLMDLAGMRRVKFADHFLKLLNQYHFHSLAPDQDYINAITRDRMTHLDESWNVQGDRPQVTTPKIIHYNLFDKPWHYAQVPNDHYFWHYADELPQVAANLRATRTAFGEKQVQGDIKHKQDLMTLAATTGAEPITFASVEAQGGQVQI